MTKFHNNGNFVQWLIIILGLIVVINVAGIYADYMELDLLMRIPNTPKNVSLAGELRANDIIQKTVSYSLWAFTFIAGALFLAWVYLSNQNLHTFNLKHLKYTPDKALGYFFMPVVNIFLAPAIMSELWKGSDPDKTSSGGWLDSRGTWKIPIWWFAVLINVIFRWYGESVKYYVFALRPTQEILLSNQKELMFSHLCGAVAGLLGIQIIREINRRQTEKALTAGLLEANP